MAKTYKTASQLLDFLGCEKLATDLLRAIEQVMVEKEVLTPDMGGASSTAAVGDRVAAILSEIV